MREIPILFNGAMVHALLREVDPKTQTRRVVKGMALEWLRPDGLTPEYVALPENRLSPYGFAGDQMWVRETFFAYGRWETRFSQKKGRDEWHFIDMTQDCDRAYQYAADGPDIPLAKGRGGVLSSWWKRPAIFMPRVASRITLEITDVRVERLHEISHDDAREEGIFNHSQFYGKGNRYPGLVGDGFMTPREAYAHLWDSLNAERGYGWDANPFVWVVEFKRVTP